MNRGNLKLKQSEQKKCLICFLSSQHPLDDKRVYAKEGRSLAKAGYQVVHLGKGDTSGVHDGVEFIPHSPVATTQSSILKRLSKLYLLGKKASALRADVYHCNELDSWLIGVSMKLLHGSKVVFDVHEHYPSMFVEDRLPSQLQFFRKPAYGCFTLLYSLLSPLTDLFVYAKESVKQDFHFARNKEVSVLNYAPLSETLLDVPRKKQTDGFFHCVHLGGYSELRGWRELLQALTLVKDASRYRFHFIGSNLDNDKEAFPAAIKQLGFEENFLFYPWLPFDEAFQLVRKADLGLVLLKPGIMNHVYAMPHKMFDYMLAGIPVIIPSFSEEIVPMIKSSESGLCINTGSAIEIAKALEELSNTPERCEEMGKNGRKAVKEVYNWEIEAQKLCKAYEQLLSDSKEN